MTCAKIRVFATLTGASGSTYTAENKCLNPQVICPREEGDGYEKCVTVCKQVGHAETQAIALAGDDARGGSIVVSYSRICGSCLQSIKDAGIVSWLTDNRRGWNE